MKRRSILALSMAAVTALTSTSIVAFADNANSEALAAAITLVKSRVDIPEELSEFNYSVSNQNLKTVFYLTWSTPRTSAMYKEASATVCGDLILGYSAPYDWNRDNTSHFSELTGDQLYKKAKEHLKKLDPSIYSILNIDRDSLSISLYGNRASFSVVRTKNGIPVKNDSGRMILDKDTGELIDFSLNWHQNASFQSADSALSESRAKEAYAEMIGLYPQYEFDYDYDKQLITPRIVYRQSDYGEINAFTGKKSDFAEDGYYVNEDVAETEEADGADYDKGNPSTGGFTPDEQDEINKDLPYCSKDAVIKLLKENKWLTYYDDMTMRSSRAYMENVNGKKYYFFTVSFTNETWDEDEYWDEIISYGTVEEAFDEEAETAASQPVKEKDPKEIHSVSITVNAQTGEIMEYDYYNSNSYDPVNTYDMTRADAMAKEIASSFSGDKFSAYSDHYTSASNGWTDQDGKEMIVGSNHNWTRYENGIKVSRDYISIYLDNEMRLSSYKISYTDIALPSPDGMLTEKQAMKKFWEDNDLNLYYLAAVNKKKTKTVLVYGANTNVYIDAFTGEPIYTWYMKKGKNDFSGITDKKILKMAKKLDDHGILVSEEKFSQDDPVTYAIFGNVIGGSYTNANDEDRNITRSAALIAYTRSVTSDDVAKIKGIYKSPFSDISDDNPRVGYYAIAYGMGAFTEKKLDPTAYFTYGDLIKMVYSMYSAK